MTNRAASAPALRPTRRSPSRCEVRGQIVIHAPIERVYAIAVDPAVVPRYASEIARIEVLSRRDGVAHVVSHLRVLGFTMAYRYRYRYHQNSYYGGVQEGGRLVRGYFTMRFHAVGEQQTRVSHVEGIMSRVPGVARFVGWIYFRLLGGDDIDSELQRLKTVVEEERS